MRLRVLLPSRVVLDEAADKLSAETENGAFTVLPRHIDMVTSLVPGLLSFVKEGQERFLAVDRGVLVKRADDVWVSTWNAVIGEALGRLQQTVEEQFQQLDERERRARASLMRLEADFVRRFLELESHD